MPVFKTPHADLRAKYGIYLKVGFILSISIIIAAFTLTPKITAKDTVIIDKPERPKVMIPPTIQKKKPPPLPKQPELVSKPDEIIEEPEYENNEIDQKEIILLPPPLSNRPIMEEENVPFLWSQVMPEPIGGIPAIKEKIKYTSIGIKAHIEGKVIIEVTIGKDGHPYDAVILKGIGGGLDEVALNAVMQTKFMPGLQRDKPVNVRIKIPIRFELN